MAINELPSGVRVSVPETFTLETEPTRRGPRDLPSGPVPIGAAPGPDMAAALEAADFEVVDRVELTPTSEATSVTGVRRRSAPAIPAEQPVEVSVDVPPGEEAVVLVEQDGVYSWVLPSESETTTRAGGVRTFDLSLRADIADEARTRGFIDDLIYSKATAFVLRYVAPPLGRAAIRHFEKVEEGLVVMSADGPARWRHAEPGDLTMPAQGRILLFVHGTFSSTSNSFGPLWQTEEGQRFLADADQAYDLVLGVDHPTLSVNPLENAERIAELLSAIPGSEGAVIDALGYSRGGLVLRSLIERVLPESDWIATVRKAAFVGVTHHGTILASPKHWHQLIDLYTNLVVAGAGGLSVVIPGAAPPAAIISSSLKVIGAAVKALATQLIDDETIPGLAAMQPDGAFVASINERQPNQPAPDTIDYFAITSDFDADDATDELPSRMKFILKDGLMDRLMGEDNDLVVNTSSMTSVEPGYLKDTWEFGTNGTVFHTNYFQQPEVPRALANWWELAPETAAAEPPMAAAPEPPRAVAPEQPRRTRGAGGEGPPPAAIVPDGDSGPVEMDFSAGMDEQVTRGETASIEVRIGDDQISAGEWATGTGTVDASVPIIVQLMCRSGFRPEGEKRITVDPPTGETIVRYFDVTATDLGTGQIDIVFRQGQVPILTLTLAPEVVAGAPESTGEVRGSGSAAAAAPLAVPLHQLRISERMSDGQIVYDFDFESETLGVLIAATSRPLQVDRVSYVAKLFSEIEDRWVGASRDAANFRQDLRAFGSALFDELVPPDIQQAMWENRDRIDAIQVLSTEPFIPWEIVHLKEPGGSLGQEEHFLGSKGLVRWLHGSWPPSEIRVRPDRVRAIIPAYPEGTNYQLPEAEAEMAFLSNEFGATPVGPTTQEVRELISQPGSFDLLHFAGHGTADQGDVGKARLMMQGRVENNAYVPEYLNATTVSDFGNLSDENGNRPIVVLNACQVGRAGYLLTSIGGFAAAFTRAGAGAFVSSLWSVGDAPARTFTETWYRELLNGKTVTEATIAARQAAADASDATWLAYTVYAHPHAVIVPG